MHTVTVFHNRVSFRDVLEENINANMLFINIVFRDSICVRLSEWKITKPSFNHLIYFPTQKSQKDQRNDLNFFACIKEVFPHVVKSLVHLMFSKYPYVFIILEVSTFKLTFV